ncbi:hypothetical protein QR680_010659 [Steinernema hermaphroditum]|uniref:AB hydrolase-1 domain-containing protein n=1 Tax=Steinernema hermaphroditum TaxID=289476 RepID=A0AA39IPQ0_9BILA|nr:hypothetical protein QR680_010659 [Steinernema hermaphroditum]
MSIEHLEYNHRHAPRLTCSSINNHSHHSSSLFASFFNLISWGILLYVEFLYYFVKIITFPFSYVFCRAFGFVGECLHLPRPTEEGIAQSEAALFSEAAKTVQFESFRTELRADKVPLVLLHEMGGGVGCWARNIKDFADHRPTYAVDILGFGRSGRYDTSPCATLTELDYVSALEDWRKAMGIDKMVLLGHQFGGFIASSYSLEHPSRVRHLVLVEPWGFQEEPHTDENLLQDFPVWMRGIGALTSLMLPLFFVRLLGPLGIAPGVFRMFNASHMKNFAPWKPKAFSYYFYECNAQDPSGERSFVTMSHFCWPRRPMIHRFGNVDFKLPVTLIFGSRSNFDRELPKELQDKRPESFTCVQEIWCGSRPHCEAPEEFNNDILVVCDRVDENKDILYFENPHENH